MGGPAHVDGKTIEELDNFSYTPFTYNGVQWVSSEQAYQASKFSDPIYVEQIRQTTQANRYYQMGQSRQHQMKVNFDRVAEMTAVLRAKFSVPKLQRLLLRTKGVITFPESDTFWGPPHNQLGNILMSLREEFRSDRSDL